MLNKFPSLCLTAIAVSVALHPMLSVAEEMMEQITVTATRSSRDINEITSYVSVIDSEQMQQQLVTDIRDLVRYEPGVTVEGGGRFGLAGFNIRGINGDRVLMLLDGVPLADEFSFGPALSARRDFVDVDLLESVEIIRGPASTLYGSDAIGGVVAFVSKDPKNIVAEGEQFGGRAKLGYMSASDEWWATGQIAGYQGDWQWLLTATERRGNEFDSYFDGGDAFGPNRVMAEPQENESTSGQFKLIYSPNESHRLTWIADMLQGDTQTDVLSQVGTSVRGVRIDESIGIDTRERTRVQMNYEYRGEQVLFDKVLTRVFWQRSQTEQDTFDTRVGPTSRMDPTPLTTLRSRNSQFDQRIRGGLIQFDKQFSGFGEHYLIYGSELQLTNSVSLRNGATVAADSGQNLPEFVIFPTRDFPESDARELSFFIQDEIQFLDGKLMLSPGVRYDKFRLTPQQDALFTAGNPGVETSAFNDSELSAKLGALYKIDDSHNIWLQFAEGFRIPPFDDLNVGFTNFAGGYTSLANPDLEPERVKSWELGMRGTYAAFDWGLSVYHNRYDNFIESLAVRGFNPATGLLEFQARNLNEVVIRGVDARFGWYLGESFDALKGFRVNGAFTWLESEDKATGLELDSILPPQAVIGVGYGMPEDPWSLELVATAVQRFDAQQQPQDTTQPQFFEAPGYLTLDLLGHVKLAEPLTLNYGVFNLTDRQVWPGSEVRGRTVDENLGRFTQPGRNFTMTLTYIF